MALVFDATVGGASANSYVTVAAADAYFETRFLAEAWTALANADKEKALVAATMRLETERWVGYKATDDQALQWPRLSVLDSNDRLVDSDAIPSAVQYATCEVALDLVQQTTAGTDPNALTGLEPFTGLSIGPVQLSLRSSGRAPGALPTLAIRWLAPFRMAAGTTRFERSS